MNTHIKAIFMIIDCVILITSKSMGSRLLALFALLMFIISMILEL